MISLNAPAPDFEALTTDGKRFRLSERRGRPVVLYFFPKAFTPGCTKEAKQFSEVHPDIQALGAEVVGISTDPHELQCEFAGKVGATFPMVADTDGSICRRYDVVWPLLKLAKRVTFVIDAAGIIRGIFHYEFRVDQHARSVLQALKGMAAPIPARS